MKILKYAFAAACMAASANATTIDFNSFTSATSYTVAGVTITATDGLSFRGSATPNGTIGLLSNSFPMSSLRADIAGHANFVSIDLGDFDSDADRLFLQAYNSSDVLIGSESVLISASFNGMKTLSLSVPGIDHVIFGSKAPSLTGSSVYADNFTFGFVPEPITLSLFGAGIAGAAALRRRRAMAGVTPRL